MIQKESEYSIAISNYSDYSLRINHFWDILDRIDNGKMICQVVCFIQFVEHTSN